MYRHRPLHVTGCTGTAYGKSKPEDVTSKLHTTSTRRSGLRTRKALGLVWLGYIYRYNIE